MIWYKDSKDDIMVSTRVRLARNVGKYPFPMMLNEKGRELVKKELVDGVLESNSTLSKEFTLTEMKDLSPQERQMLAE
jgi:protein arginine kinase